MITQIARMMVTLNTANFGKHRDIVRGTMKNL